MPVIFDKGIYTSPFIIYFHKLIMTFKKIPGGVYMYNKSWRHPKGGQCQPQYCPPHRMPTQYNPSQPSPTKQYVKTNVINTVIPVFHPTHTTTVNKHFNTYIPHTRSILKECYSQSFVCGVPQPPSYSRRMLRY
jgi:spore coat protein D